MRARKTNDERDLCKRTSVTTVIIRMDDGIARKTLSAFFEILQN